MTGAAARAAPAAAVLATLATGAGAAEAPWAVTAATHRIELEIVRPPSRPVAGVVAIVPDGGLLPGPTAKADVLDENGRPLACGVIWHNPREGLGVCFEAPRSGSRITLYLQPSARGENLAAASGSLKPGPLMFTAAGGATPSLNQAEAIAREAPPGRRARMAVVPVIAQGENRLGPDDHYVSYYSAWLDIAKGGRYFLCTVCDEGSEIRVNGQTLVRVTGRHKRQEGAKGEWGEWITLEPGLHAMEYLHYEIDGPQEAHVCWREPGSTNKLPATVPKTAFLQSGEARVVSGRTRDNAPLALWQWEPIAYAWAAERPLNMFQFRALVPVDDSAAAIEWTLDGRSMVREREFLWFWEDEDRHTVSLQTGRDRAATMSSRDVLVAYYPRRLSLDAAADRQMIRRAFETRLRAGPADRRPVSDWTPNMWATLLEALDAYNSGAIPSLIIERSRPDLLKQPPARRWRVEDLYAEQLRLTDPAAALLWMQKAIQEEMNTARRLHWMRERARIHAFDRGEFDEARRIVREAQPQAVDPETAVRLLVTAGDIERLALQRDEAARLYAAAQDRYREHQKTSAQMATVRREAETNRTLAARLGGDWRIGAVREGQNLVTVDNLVRQQAWDEARRVLDQWEIEFPLSRLDGDQPLAEATFYLGVGDARRALRILRAYRQLVDMSSQLARAMELERRCLLALDMRRELDELAREIERRFPGATSAVSAKPATEPASEPRRPRRERRP